MQAAVGDCIHAWCMLEHALVDVLSWTLNTPHYKAGVVFSTVHSFAVKLDLINELMEDDLEGRDELTFWRSIVSNLRTLSGARNVLAHHSPMTRVDQDFDDPSKWRSVISANNYDPRPRMDKRRGFTLVDVQFLATDIKRHEGLLSEFVYHLDGMLEKPRVFCKKTSKLELYNELQAKPKSIQRKRKKTRTRIAPKPPMPLDGLNAEQIAEVLAKHMDQEFD